MRRFLEMNEFISGREAAVGVLWGAGTRAQEVEAALDAACHPADSWQSSWACLRFVCCGA